MQPLTVLVAIVGAVAVVTFSVISFAVHRRTEQHLLDLQVREAASTVAAALPAVQAELEDGLQVAEATHSAAAFQQFARARILSQPSYHSASLWQESAGTVTEVASVGTSPRLLADGRLSFLQSMHPAAGLQIAPLLSAGEGAVLGIADMPPDGHGLIAYVESSLPPDRHLNVPSTNPFHNIDLALYLNSVTPQNLLESTGPTPIRGRHAVAADPFGDATIVMVGSTGIDLAGSLLADLPWIVLGAGLALVVGAAAMVELIGRRRRRAEELAAENQRLYLEQRDIATTVQQALLPEVPELEELEAGARYLAGTAGIDVGGDWYDLVCRPGSCTFVVGDVCGRGLQAATTMASLRFATRAYIAEGDGPREIIEKLGRLHDLDGGELFATVLIGQIDIAGRRVTLVNAGHPPLLIVTPSGAAFADVPPSTPVGVGPSVVTQTEVEFSPDSVLVAYTDGLVERRDLAITAGLERLRTAGIDPKAPVETILDQLVDDLLPGGAVDDTAILAVRWRRNPAAAGEPAAGSASPGALAGN